MFIFTIKVNSRRSALACAAIKTLAELYVDLQKAMDPEVEGTGRAVLLKLVQTTNAFIQIRCHGGKLQSWEDRDHSVEHRAEVRGEKKQH